jgi:DNA-binding transcriptional ArsR family regulator
MYKTISKREEVFASKMAVVGDPHRLRMICFLSEHERSCVSEVAEALDLPIANASHHLRALCTQGVLDSVRDGKKICYMLSNDQFAKELKNFICKLKII